MTVCSLCAKGVGYEMGLTHVEVSLAYDVSEASVRRHRKHVEPEINDETLEGFAKSHGVDPETLVPYGVSYVSENGWVKYRVREAVDSALSYEDIDFSPVEFIPSLNRADGTDMLNTADWQIGKACEKGGGTPQTVEVIKRGYAAFEDRLRVNGYRTAILSDGGDSMEGIWNTPSQPFTNDLDLTAQIRTVRRLRAEGIKQIAPLVDHLIVVTVPSNHGEVRVGKQAQAGSTEADFGLDIHESLKEIFADRSEYEHVEFIRPDPLELTAVLDVSGTRVAVNHGHTAGNGAQDKKWWAGQDHGRMPGWDADILVLNHLHHQSVQPSGNGRSIVRTASADPGSGWYANKTGESSKRGQTAFTILNGEVLNLSTL